MNHKKFLSLAYKISIINLINNITN